MRQGLVQGFLVLVLTACAGQSQPQVATEDTSKCQPSGKSSGGGASYLADPAIAQVTFYGDLLPILRSQSKDKVYKCTTCHAHYNKPDSMNNLDEINRVIESMENGRMPRGGDFVPKDKIEMFRIWQLQGFQLGDKDNPKPSGVTPGSTGSSGQSQDQSAAPSQAGGCP